jgi:hypothetical protein
MSVGDILDRGLRLLTSRLLTFYVINLVVLAPILVAQLLQPQLGLMLEGNAQGQPQMSPEDAAKVLAFVGVVFLSLFLQPIGVAASLYVISQEFVDRSVGIGQAFRFAFRRFGSLLWASLLKGLVVMAGMFMFCFPFVLFSIWYVFVPQVVVVEGYHGGNALARSKELTRGFRWRVFGLMALIFILEMILLAASGALAGFLPIASPVRTETGIKYVTNYQNFLVNLVFRYIIQILVATYRAICYTLCYFDLRIRKEGLDLELAAQQQSAEMGEAKKTGLDPYGLE